jgi:hypothetical protein
MNPSAVGRRFLGPLAVLAVAASVFLVGPRIVKAFTLPPDILFFDPISVPVDHTLHVHLVNHLGAGPLEFRAFIVPTTPAAGASVVGSAITLNVGQGSDEAFPFAGFGAPPGATSVPVVVTIMASIPGAPPGTPLPPDWSGTVASSVEIVSDKTALPTAILGGRHVMRADRSGGSAPCLFCN